MKFQRLLIATLNFWNLFNVNDNQSSVSPKGLDIDEKCMDIREIPDLDLKIVIARFEKGKELENHDQTTIAKCVIKYLLHHNPSRT